MLHPPTIIHACLLKALSLSAVLNQRGTGSFYQVLILRALKVRVAGPVAISRGATLIAPCNLTLGKYVAIGTNCHIVSRVGVEIGDDFMASDLLNINDGDHDPVTLRPELSPIRIGNRVWCGTNVTICAGVEVGDDAIIGSGSVVVKSIPAGWIAVGVPAKPIRKVERTGPDIWSLWPERSCDSRFKDASPLKRSLFRLRSRL